MTADERRPPRFCLAAVLRRRRVAKLLDQVLAELHPPEPPEPSTFGLTEPELRAEANRLHRGGWTMHEVTAVLDVEPKESHR